MTGTSARETSRPAKRLRPSAGSKAAPMAPPVLFRLPSIAQTPGGVDSSAAMSIGITDNAIDMAIAATTNAPVTAQAVQNMSSASATQPFAPVAGELKDKKAAGRRLLGIVVMVLVMLALVIITSISMQPAKLSPKMASSQDNKGSAALESLGNLQVPAIKEGQSASTTTTAPTSGSVPNLSEATSTTSANSSAREKSNDTDKNAPGSLMLGLDTGDFPVAPRTSSPAQVQLGRPIAMRSSTSLVDSQQKSPSASLPLTTPRYETVSTPSSAQGSNDKSTPTDSGASPGLWDGAKGNASSELELTEGLTLSPPVGSTETRSSETTRTPSMTLGGPAPSKSQPSLDLDASGSLIITSADGSQASSDATTALSAADDPLGVTVGGGFKEPNNLASATATPDMDVAAISQRYVEYSRQRNVAASSSSTLVNPYAPSAGPSTVNPTTMPGSAGSYPQNYAPTGAAATTPNNGSPNAYPPNSAPQARATGGNPGVQYGTTGGLVTHYVRNAPGSSTTSGPQQYPNGNGAPSQQSGQGGYVNSGYSVLGVQPSGATPAGSPISQSANAPAQAMNGQAMNGQTMGGQAMNGQTMGGQAMNGQAMNGQAMNGQTMGGQIIPPRAGAATTWPSNAPSAPSMQPTNPTNTNPAYPSPAYQNAAHQNPANANPQYANPQYANPQNGAPTFNPQTAAGRPGVVNPSMPTIPGAASGASMTSPAMRTSAPTTSGYPAGQAPLSLIGQSGFATAPSGDVVNSAPIPVSGKIGYGNAAAPSGMPAGMPPMGAGSAVPSTQGGNAYRPQPGYGTTPQF